MDWYLNQPVRPGSETPSLGGWDLHELLERLDGDREFLRELLEIFRLDGPPIWKRRGSRRNRAIFTPSHARRTP